MNDGMVKIIDNLAMIVTRSVHLLFYASLLSTTLYILNYHYCFCYFNWLQLFGICGASFLGLYYIIKLVYVYITVIKTKE